MNVQVRLLNFECLCCYVLYQLAVRSETCIKCHAESLGVKMPVNGRCMEQYLCSTVHEDVTQTERPC